MTPDEPNDVIGHLPRSRPARRSPRRDAAQAKAAGAEAKATAEARPTAAASGNGKPDAPRGTKPAASPRPTAARPKAGAKAAADSGRPAIPPAGYAVPGVPSSDERSDVLAEAVHAIGQLAHAGLSLVRGLLGRG